MIRAEFENTGMLNQFCSCTPFGCKILTNFFAYGTGYPFARFWIQQNERGAVTAALCKLDGSIVLDAAEDADFLELKQFISACGGTALCSGRAAGILAGENCCQTGRVLLFEGACPQAEEEAEQDPSARDLYPLLAACRSDHFSPPPFEPFYLDLSHRYRHGAALASGFRREDSLAACAIAPAITKNMAVISAVAVHPKFRRQGLGSKAIRALLARLGKRQSFVFRAEQENQEFYERLGFLQWGAWSELTF